MAGPNSAPNGDRRLVRGDPHEEFVYIERHDKNGELYFEEVPLRVHLAQKRQLRTGKTK